ncbi:hypothetical protein [Hymenobacter fodinae]|uniref:Uncharacterized protein n=1 Tax=Hymenobacter fodinae TaxID=2510796 RepID=A0A4Z0P6H0_9BACT|nr:hypothetical protein [Hymenobacter fodinae]TGE07739.1 hypothetical protein EU556_08270 [Hymenobacter fodinae]
MGCYHERQRLNGLLFHSDSKFATWEAFALMPSNVNPSEWQDRLRIAETIYAIRCGKEPELAPFVVLAELRQLIYKQTKAKNAARVYSQAEIDSLLDALETRSDWSELLRWLKNVRKETEKRYQASRTQLPLAA